MFDKNNFFFLNILICKYETGSILNFLFQGILTVFKLILVQKLRIALTYIVTTIMEEY